MKELRRALLVTRAVAVVMLSIMASSLMVIDIVPAAVIAGLAAYHAGALANQFADMIEQPASPSTERSE